MVSAVFGTILGALVLLKRKPHFVVFKSNAEHLSNANSIMNDLTRKIVFRRKPSQLQNPKISITSSSSLPKVKRGK